MRFVILGYGQIGSYIDSHLIRNDTTSYSYSVHAINKQSGFDVSSIDSVRWGLSSYEDDDTVVINCAAVTDPAYCEQRPHEAFSTNTIGAYNVMRVCDEIGARHVYLSTDYVFGGGMHQLGHYTERSTPSPVNVYGLSKFAGEQAVMQGDKFTIVRTSGVFGFKKPKGFIGKFLDTVGKGRTMMVVDDQFLSPTYIGDFYKRLMEIIEHPERPIYHVVNSGTCSWYEFAAEYTKQLAMTGVKVGRVIPVSTKELGDPTPRPFNTSLQPTQDSYYAGMRSWQDALSGFVHVG